MKVPSAMSREEALKVLAVEPSAVAGVSDEVAETVLRKAYHKLAAKYHPDKNPEPSARELFERVQKAYELLGSEPRATGGPDPRNIALMLQAQVQVQATRKSTV